MTAGGRGGAGAPARSGSAPDRGGGSTLVSHQQQTTRTAASSGDDGHGRGSSRSGQQAHGAGAPPVVPLTEEQVLKKLEDNLVRACSQPAKHHTKLPLPASLALPPFLSTVIRRNSIKSEIRKS